MCIATDNTLDVKDIFFSMTLLHSYARLFLYTLYIFLITFPDF
jgi:hypothetical protein